MAENGRSSVFADDAVEKVGRLARMLDALGEHPLLRGNLALQPRAARFAAGELDASPLFEAYPEIAERANRNPVALRKLNGIRTAIERGILEP